MSFTAIILHWTKKEKQLINKSKKKNERQKREIPCKISITYQIENQSAWFRWVSVTLRYLQEMETDLCVLQCCLQMINLEFYYVLFYYIIFGLFCFPPVYISFLIFGIFELNQTLPNMLKCVLRPATPFFYNFFTKKNNFLGKLTSAEITVISTV